MSLNEHTQFFGGPNEPAQKTPPLSPPNMPPLAATPPPPAATPAPVAPKPKKDYSKVAGALAIGAVAVGSVGFISWTVFEGEEAPEPVKPAVQAPTDSIVPELPKEEFIESPVAPVETPSLPPPPPPAPKPSGGAPKPKPAPEPEPVATPVLPDEIKIAEVSDDSEFKDAFIEARDQVGPGGLFEYKGQWYSTYSIEEWNVMPKDMQTEFTNRIEPIVNPVEVEEPAAVVEDSPDVVKLDTDNDGVEETTMADKNHDGFADIVIKDEPGEGISGYMYVDKNNDGKLETAFPISDEGEVLEDKAEILENPLQVPMNSDTASSTANSLSSLGETEVVDLDTNGDSALETAVPLGLDGHPIMAQVTETPSAVPTEDAHLHHILDYGSHDASVTIETDLATDDDLFTA
ncbi:hypothetical protein [Runella sp.]|uniref:hypothetical protein n=1 Tax=Runella sp. TaxID=1960881 RepID=UPI003D0D08A7